MCFSSLYANSKSQEASVLLSLGWLHFALSCPALFHTSSTFVFLDELGGNVTCGLTANYNICRHPLHCFANHLKHFPNPVCWYRVPFKACFNPEQSLAVSLKHHYGVQFEACNLFLVQQSKQVWTPKREGARETWPGNRFSSSFPSDLRVAQSPMPGLLWNHGIIEVGIDHFDHLVQPSTYPHHSL